MKTLKSIIVVIIFFLFVVSSFAQKSNNSSDNLTDKKNALKNMDLQAPQIDLSNNFIASSNLPAYVFSIPWSYKVLASCVMTLFNNVKQHKVNKIVLIKILFIK